MINPLFIMGTVDGCDVPNGCELSIWDALNPDQDITVNGLVVVTGSLP